MGPTRQACTTQPVLRLLSGDFSGSGATPPGTALDKDITVWSELRNRKATLMRSDATKIPYDKEIGSITIESQNRPKQYIRLRRFRTVEIKWINDRLLYINCDIGHTASVDAIFDAQTGKWTTDKACRTETIE